ncbi:hypothetical protein [Phenylobacterium sp.]|uniref:hypothetical protein n=1 Tax=Phenylobacterium sp. TaxID=1871053 RepID=UPI001229AA71|nr:hypothetical protein [Phenylobacterium sp.]THD61600.1 MAG: hypothetical protein E8A49_11555 [Phenylobacterium sp.]
MRLAFASAIALLALPLAGQAQTPRSERPFFAELARQCPAQNLQKLSPADLDGFMEGFANRLTSAQARALQDTVGARCARIEAGLSCGNNATLDAYRRFHLLKAFTGKVCASGLSCRGVSDCIKTTP